jgi:hypothetical protein
MPPNIAQMSSSDLLVWFAAKSAAQGKTLDESWAEVHADWEADRDGTRRTLASELEAALISGAVDRWLYENLDVDLTRQDIVEHIAPCARA